MKKTGLFGVLALGLFGLTAPASAVTIVIDSAIQRNAAFGPDFFPLALQATGPANTFIGSAPGNLNGISYSFTGGTAPGSGIYTGAAPVGSPVTASPYGDAAANANREFFSAEGGGGTAKLTYSSTQNSLSMLWGTVDAGDSRNVITTNGGNTITGADVLAACGGACFDGQTEVWLTILGLNNYTVLTFSDGGSPAFEFNVAAVPELSTWGMMILGFFGLGFIGYRKSKASGAAFRLA